LKDSPPLVEKSFLKGAAGLIIALAVVLVLLIMLPAYRLFFGISAALGVIVWRVLVSWHKFKPVKEEDVDNKRPLGLD
jgi:uncharacterized membrane protein YesL